MFPAIDPDDVAALTALHRPRPRRPRPDRFGASGDRPDRLAPRHGRSVPIAQGEPNVQRDRRVDPRAADGPGGPFEVSPRSSTASRDEGLQGPVPEPAGGARSSPSAHGDKEFLVYGDRRMTFADFLAEANACQPRLWLATPGSATATGWRCCRPEQPRVVHGVLGHGRHRRDAGRAQRLVEHRRDHLRPRGLRRQGARGRHQALRTHRRRSSTSIDDLERVLPDRRRPRRPERGLPSPKLRPSPSSSPSRPTTFPDDRHRRGRPRRHLLHVGHHRPTQGRDQHPPQHGRQPPEHRVHC